MKAIITIILFLLITTYGFTQTQEEITRAIDEGDCAFLFDFLQEPEGKERRLLESARQAIERYTRTDTAAARYRTNRMDARVRNVGNELLENVFLDPETYLPRVVERLLSGVSDTFSRVKILHDWICYYIDYDTDHYFGWEYNRQDYVSVIRNKKAVCSGYASLFNQMCRLANITSISINGFSKGAGYNGSLRDYPDHDWNAVKIGSKWYLIDVTWNAGYLEYYSYIKKYSTDYLFLDSRAFLYTHLPVENKYQFYAPVVTREQFIQEPKVDGIFFRYGLELRDGLPQYNNTAEDSFRFELVSRNNSVTINSRLRTTRQVDVQNGARQSRNGNVYTFTYTMPDNQPYMGHVFARFSNERSIWERISIEMYEQEIVPMLDRLLENRRITEREKNYFLESYYKIEINGYYYFLDDQFAAERNSAVLRIHPMVNLSLGMLNSVLSFNVRREVL